MCSYSYFRQFKFQIWNIKAGMRLLNLLKAVYLSAIMTVFPFQVLCSLILVRILLLGTFI